MSDWKPKKYVTLFNGDQIHIEDDKVEYVAEIAGLVVLTDATTGKPRYINRKQIASIDDEIAPWMQ